MEKHFINDYYNICRNKIINIIYNYKYIPPDNIDYLDFSLLVDFTTRCMLIKMGMLPEHKNIDIDKYVKPTPELKSYRFINHIIDVYKKCSTRSSYIDIDKAIVFWNTYCIIKAYIYKQYPALNIESLPPYLMDSIYDKREMFPSIINGVKYTIYTDFEISIIPVYYYIINKCQKYIPESDDDTNVITGWDGVLKNFHLYPINICIQVLKITHSIDIHISFSQLWMDALHILINNIQGTSNYPKFHPYSIMTSSVIPNIYKISMFKCFFNIS